MKRRNIIWHRTGNVNSERESAKECARYYGAGESKGTFMYWAALSLRGYNSQIPLTSSIFIAGTKSGECREKNKKTKKKTNKKPRRRKKCVWCLLVVGSADGAIVIDCTTAAVDGPFSDATRYNIWAAHNAAVTLRQLARIDESTNRRIEIVCDDSIIHFELHNKIVIQYAASQSRKHDREEASIPNHRRVALWR